MMSGEQTEPANAHSARGRELQVVQSFWTGSLSTMERFSVASFVANGHEVHVYGYDDPGDLPQGAVVKDAAEMIPRRSFGRRPMYRDSRGSYAGFSDLFRYKLLEERGGWWIDLDMVCLRPFDFAEEYVFASEPDLTVGSCAFRVPSGSEVMACAYERSLALGRKGKKWGSLGPALLAEMVDAFGLADCVVNHNVFVPVDWPDWETYLDPRCEWSFGPETHGIHLWNSLWAKAGRDKDAAYPYSCLYEQLKRRYL
jgi:hypothetical protein